MKIVGVAVVVALCVIQSHQIGMNDATKAIYEAREKIRNVNPQDIMKNISSLITSALPKDIVQSTPHALKDFLKHFIRNATDPENIRIFLKLVKESKMKKKGEIVRMTLKFMNPDNLHAEGLIRTFQSLDELTVSELAGITLEYIKEVAPQFLGSSYGIFEKFFNLINPEDVSAITIIWFKIFRETDSDDLLWFIRRVKEEIRNGFILGKKYMRTNGNTMVSEFQSKGKDYLQEKARVYVHDMKKIANFEKFSPHVIPLTKALKTAAINLVAATTKEVKEEVTKLDGKKLPFNITATIKRLISTISQFKDFIDLDDIGADVENGIIFLKKLNQTTALNAEKQVLKFLPSADELIKIVNKTHLLDKLSPTAKADLFSIIKSLSQVKLPDKLLGFINGGLLSAVRMVDEKIARGVVEFLIKESRNDNKIYRTFKAIAFRNIRDYTEKFHHINLKAANWDEFQKELISFIKRIDEKMVSEMVQHILVDLKHIDATTVSDIVNESSSVASALISQDWLEKLLKNPITVLEMVNKTTFSDFVALNMNFIRLINETQVSFWCKNLASLASDELDKKVDNATMWVKIQFERVEDGHETAQLLKVNETTQTVAKIVKTMDLKQACDDVASVLKLNRVLGKEARQEIVNLLWSVFYKVQRAASGDVVNQQMIQNIQEVLNALLRVLIKLNNNKPDIKSRSVRMVMRNVDDYAKTGKLRIRLRRSAREVREDNELYEAMSKEGGYNEVEDDLSYTIIPFDPNVRYSLKIPQETMNVSKVEPKLHTEDPKKTDVPIAPTMGVSKGEPKIDTEVQKKPEAPKETTNSVKESSQSPTTESVATMRHYVHHTILPTPAITQVYKTEKQIQHSKCARDVREVVVGAWESHTWAGKMFDGWLQLRTVSNSSHSGIVHQCLSIEHPTQSFSPQFCSANITVPFLWPGEITPEVMTFTSGVCLPSTCTPEDFSEILRETLQGSTMRISIDRDTCKTSHHEETTKQAKSNQLVLAVIVALILASTFHDVFIKMCTDKRNGTKLTSAISLKSTGLDCFSTTDKGPQAALYGLQALGLAWVVANCSIQCVIAAGIISKQEIMDNIWLSIPLNIYAATDILLFAGGALAALSFRRAIDESGNFGIFLNVLKRLMIWIPCMGVMIVVRNGFFSNATKLACSSSWWHHLLFIQNFLAHDTECLPQSWYLSLEMQLFSVTPLILVIPISNTRVKSILTFTGAAVMAAVSIILVARNDDPLEPFPSHYNSQFQWDVVKPYMRFVPWVVGIVVGEILHSQGSSGSKVQISRRWSSIATVCSLGLLATCAFTAKFFTYSLRSHWQIAVYLGVSHFAIALSLAIIVLISANNAGGWVRGIVTCGALKVLGRLTFCAYLVHMTVVCFKMDHSFAKYMDTYDMGVGIIGDYFVTQIAAVALSLFIELPLSHICDIFNRKYGQRNTSEILIASRQIEEPTTISTIEGE